MFLKRRSLLLGVVSIVVLMMCVWGAHFMSRAHTDIQSRGRQPRAELTVSAPKDADGIGDKSAKDEPSPERATVSGELVDSSGVPVAGADVSVSLRGSVEPGGSARKATTAPTQEDTTSPEGRFTLAVSITGVEYVFRANARGYIPYTQTLLVPEKGLQDLRFVLQSLASISGRVVDPARKPLPRILVKAFPIDSPTLSKQSLLTGDDGSFRILDLDGGNYRLATRYVPSAWANGWPGGISLEPLDGMYTTVAVREGEQREGIELVVPWSRDRGVEGNVYDEQGIPIEGVDVWAQYCDTPAGAGILGLATNKTGRDGRFRIDSVQGDGRDGQTRTNVIDVRCACPEYETAILKRIPVGTKNAEITLKRRFRGTIRGVVLDRASRRPVPTAKVFLWNVALDGGAQWSSDGNEIANRLASGKSNVDADGRFEIADVLAGDAALIAYEPSYGLSRKQDIPVEGDSVTEIEFLLDAAGQLDVTVVYTGQMEGQKAECEVRCWPLGEIGKYQHFGPQLQEMIEGQPFREREAVDSQTYRISLSPGQYDIVAYTRVYLTDRLVAPARNWRAAQATVVSGRTTTVTIELGGTGTIQGRILAHEGDERVQIYLTPGENVPTLDETGDSFPKASLLAHAYGQAQCGYTNQEREYLINCIPQGTYTVSVFACTTDGIIYMRDKKTVTVTAEEVLTVDFP